MEDLQMFTPRQVAHVLMLSRAKTYQLLTDGAIPSVKIGRSRRIPARLLSQYIASLGLDG